jgi:hypothetical protein
MKPKSETHGGSCHKNALGEFQRRESQVLQSIKILSINQIDLQNIK